MADEQKAPKALDWVKARSECSIDSLFIALMAVVESDTKGADARSGEHVDFRVAHPAENVFMVDRKLIGSGFLQSSVIGFERTKEGGIAVFYQDREAKKAMFVAKPHVDLNGECKFEVDGVPLEPWQVSQKALEAFFFEHGLSAKPVNQ